jgi:hypothetical protein
MTIRERLTKIETELKFLKKLLWFSLLVSLGENGLDMLGVIN